jgi:hypothetical protein
MTEENKMVSFAKIYIRSLVGILTSGAVLCYGMYLGQVTTDVQLAGLGVIGACVLFDKPVNNEN